MNDNKIKGLAEPIEDDQANNRKYVVDLEKKTFKVRWHTSDKR